MNQKQISAGLLFIIHGYFSKFFMKKNQNSYTKTKNFVIVKTRFAENTFKKRPVSKDQKCVYCLYLAPVSQTSCPPPASVESGSPIIVDEVKLWSIFQYSTGNTHTQKEDTGERR